MQTLMTTLPQSPGVGLLRACSCALRRCTAAHNLQISGWQACSLRWHSLPKGLQRTCSADPDACRGCVFEPNLAAVHAKGKVPTAGSLPTTLPISLPVMYELPAFQDQRDFCPASQEALRILLSRKMCQLVEACLGCPSYLFNEQAGAGLLAGSLAGSC